MLINLKLAYLTSLNAVIGFYTSVAGSTTIDPDDLAFEDVLSNAIESQNYTRRKTLKNNTLTEHDYVNLENINVSYDVHEDNIFDEFFDSIREENNLTETESPLSTVNAMETAPTTKTVIDLLELAVKKVGSSKNKTGKKCSYI